MVYGASLVIDALVEGLNSDPFAVLGPHVEAEADSQRVVLRVFQPAARSIEVLLRRGTAAPLTDVEALPMARYHPAGVFEAVLPVEDLSFDYRLRVTCVDGHVLEIDDPYRYGRVLTDFDLHLLGEGTHFRAFEKLGAHRARIGDGTGFHFAVWAPNAARVSVLGDFNGWDGRIHPMRRLSNGIWELYLPGLSDGEPYKFEIRSEVDGTVVQKADPYGVYFEKPPASAAITWSLDRHQWRDAEWLGRRASSNAWLDRPMAIYEVHLGSWARCDEEGGRFLTYRELAERLVPYVKEMGYTHIELMPVMEHPFSGSWGYQVIGFFAPTSRFGPPEEFKYLVDECHRHDLGVILDWVPGHFPRDAHGLARFDGTALFEHEDPRLGEHKDWGTLIFNYGRYEVRNFLLSNALFWLNEYHIDGLRVDAVASILYLDYSREAGEWLPNKYGGRENLDAIDFLRQLNTLTHSEHPGTITIAEESTDWAGVSRPAYTGGLGFTYKWNMGWMHDILKYAGQDPVHRRWYHNDLTFSMLYAYTENFILPFSHDEVVHGKRSMLDKLPGDTWQKSAMLRALYGFMYGHPGKKLLFMGGEFGQWHEWNHDAGLEWDIVSEPPHAGVKLLVRDLNDVYRREPSLYELDFDPAGFRWIDCNDADGSVVSFIRRARDQRDFTVMVLNFTPVPRIGYRIGVPEPGVYIEILNTDAAVYGGSNMGNAGAVGTQDIPSHGHPCSVCLTLPPLSFLLLKIERRS